MEKRGIWLQKKTQSAAASTTITKENNEKCECKTIIF